MTLQEGRFYEDPRIMPPKSGGAIRLPEGGRIVATWEIQAIYVDGDHPMRLRLFAVDSVGISPNPPRIYFPLYGCLFATVTASYAAENVRRTRWFNQGRFHAKSNR